MTQRYIFWSVLSANRKTRTGGQLALIADLNTMTPEDLAALSGVRGSSQVIPFRRLFRERTSADPTPESVGAIPFPVTPLWHEDENGEEMSQEEFAEIALEPADDD